MINHIWTVLCKNSSIDSETNNFNLFEVLEQVTVNLKPNSSKRVGNEQMPVVLPYHSVTLWERDEIGKEEVFDIRIEVVDPSDKVLAKFNHTVKFDRNARRLRARFTNDVLPVTSEGIYHYRVLLKDDLPDMYVVKAEVPIEVGLKIDKVK